MVTLGMCVRVLINNMPAARCEDIGLAPTCCGIPPAWFKITTGSSNVFIGGSRAARLGDICKACKNIPDPPSIPAGKVMAAIGKAAGVASSAMAAAGVVAGALGVAADVAEAAVEDEAAMQSAKALSAAMGAAQMAADAAKQAVEKTMWKDPTLPPTGSIGAIIDPSHATVLIGGFPMINIPDPVSALLNRLKRYKAKAPSGNEGCGQEGEPIDVVTGANLEETVDYVVEGELPIRWQRFYDSGQARRRGPLGWGYRHFYQRTLIRDLDGFRFIDEKGKTYHFTALRSDGESSTAYGFVLHRLSSLEYRVDRTGQPSMAFTFGTTCIQGRLQRFNWREHHLAFRYGGSDRLVGMIRSDGARIRINYDERNLITNLELAIPGNSAPRIIAAYTYDEQSNLTRWVDANGHQATFEYDDTHRMIRKGDRRGYSYHYEYDDEGRCIHSFGEDGLYDIRLRYLTEPLFTEVVYSSGATWLFFYDENGTITRIIDPYGFEKQRIVNSLGRVTQEIDANGNTTEFVYDGLGGFVGRRDPFGNLFNRGDDLHRINTNPLHAPSTSSGWMFGELLANKQADKKPPASVKTDPMGRIIEILEGDGGKRSWSFDPNGNPSSYVNRDGHARRFEYASWNLLRKQIEPHGGSISFRYNARERITEVVDGGGTTSEYDYDFRDRLIEVRRHGKVRDRYVRDPADNLIEKRDSEGNMLLSFDIGPGNLKRVRRLASGETHSFEYDDRGRITMAATETHKVDIDYDEHGRCSRDVRDGRGVRYERLSENILQSTILEKYGIVFRTEETDQLTVIDPTGAQHEFRTDGHNQIVATLSNGTSISSRFDDDGRCLSIITKWKRNFGSKWERNYEYSAEGMLLREFDSFEGEHSYEYDPGHRLVAVTTPKRHREFYNYDNAGNLLAKPGLEGAMLQKGNRLAGANGHTFEYNSRDHISRRVGPNGAVSYHYDSCDRLTRVVVGGRVWSASYDAFGRRIEKGFDDEAKTTYYWDDNRACVEITQRGRVRIYVYSDKLSLVPFMFVEYDNEEQIPSEGRRCFIHVNQIGVPKRIDNDEGEAVWRARIEPYGQAHINPQSRIDFAIRFPGHWDDPEIGLFYNRFRYYSPKLGRYLQSDPLGVAGGYNLYAYPPAPLTHVDLFGLHDPKDEKEKGTSKTGSDEENANTKRSRLKKLAEEREKQRREERRQKAIDEAIDTADKSGKLDKLTDHDRAWIESDQRHKELAIDPDGDGSYRVEEAKAALQAEQEGTLAAPVRRATRKADPAEAGADFIDGNDTTWDLKDASMGADDIAHTADPPKGDKENVLVDARKMSEGDQKNLAQDVQNKLGPDSGDVEFVPKR
jgi:RHS repeat-associated protein